MACRMKGVTAREKLSRGVLGLLLVDLSKKRGTVMIDCVGFVRGGGGGMVQIDLT